MVSPYLKKTDIAAVLDVSVRTVDRLIASGRLPAIKIGSSKQAKVRIARDALEQFLADHSANSRSRG